MYLSLTDVIENFMYAAIEEKVLLKSRGFLSESKRYSQSIKA